MNKLVLTLYCSLLLSSFSCPVMSARNPKSHIPEIWNGLLFGFAWRTWFLLPKQTRLEAFFSATLPPDFWVTRNVTADVLDPNSLRVSIDYDWDLLAGWNEPLHYCTHDMLESWEGFRTQIFLLRYAVENYQINTVILVKCLLSPSPTLVPFFLTSLGRRLRWQRTCC